MKGIANASSLHRYARHHSPLSTVVLGHLVRRKRHFPGAGHTAVPGLLDEAVTLIGGRVVFALDTLVRIGEKNPPPKPNGICQFLAVPVPSQQMIDPVAIRVIAFVNIGEGNRHPKPIRNYQFLAGRVSCSTACFVFGDDTGEHRWDSTTRVISTPSSSSENGHLLKQLLSPSMLIISSSLVLNAFMFMN